MVKPSPHKGTVFSYTPCIVTEQPHPSTPTQLIEVQPKKNPASLSQPIPGTKSILMLHNYFKTAWRSLLRNQAYSVLNILGLATGMAVALLIGLWVPATKSASHLPQH